MPDLQQIKMENRVEKDFDLQFNQPQKIYFRDSEIEVWDLQPQNIRPKTIPLLFVPSWGATPRSYKEGLKIHFEAGRRIISVAFNPKTKNVDVKEIPAPLATKTATILEVLSQKKIPIVDAIGHSEGGMLLVLAATEKHDQFRNFVFEAPIGILGKYSYFDLFKRETINYFHYLKEKKTASLLETESMNQKKTDVKNWFKNTGLIKGVMDGLMLGRFEITDQFRKLCQEHKSALLAAVDDKMIDFNKINFKTKMFSFYSVEGGHFSFETKANAYAKIAEIALQNLEYDLT